MLLIRILRALIAHCHVSMDKHDTTVVTLIKEWV
jgi:hypothetical protein